MTALATAPVQPKYVQIPANGHHARPQRERKRERKSKKERERERERERYCTPKEGKGHVQQHGDGRQHPGLAVL